VAVFILFDDQIILPFQLQDFLRKESGSGLSGNVLLYAKPFFHFPIQLMDDFVIKPLFLHHQLGVGKKFRIEGMGQTDAGFDESIGYLFVHISLKRQICFDAAKIPKVLYPLQFHHWFISSRSISLK
jgi:hypothetical protein